MKKLEETGAYALNPLVFVFKDYRKCFERLLFRRKTLFCMEILFCRGGTDHIDLSSDQYDDAADIQPHHQQKDGA